MASNRSETGGPTLWNRAVPYLPLLVFFLIMNSVYEDPAIDVYGVDVPVWLFGLVMYVLGTLAGWLTLRSRGAA